MNFSLSFGTRLTITVAARSPSPRNERVALCGAKTIPVLVVDGKPMREAEEINRFLIEEYFS